MSQHWWDAEVLTYLSWDKKPWVPGRGVVVFIHLMLWDCPQLFGGPEGFSSGSRRLLWPACGEAAPAQALCLNFSLSTAGSVQRQRVYCLLDVKNSEDQSAEHTHAAERSKPAVQASFYLSFSKCFVLEWLKKPALCKMWGPTLARGHRCCTRRAQSHGHCSFSWNSLCLLWLCW